MNKVLSTSITLLALFILAGCSHEDERDTVDPADRVELGVTAGVSLTKSAIQGGDNVQSGTETTVMQNVAIRATGTSYTSAKNNDNAIYTQSSGTWTSVGTTNKIMLASDIATIYAFYPAYSYDANGNMGTTAIAVTGTTGSDATIPVSLFEGGEAATGSPATQKGNSTIADADNSSGVTILSAPGEADYLWEGSSTKPTASNGKATAEVDGKVDLNMKHALSMLSFRIYNDGSYKNAGVLTKLKLDNASGTVLNKGTSATMNIGTGAITVVGTSGATFTRLIGASGVTAGSSDTGAHRYSILVFPESVASSKNTVQATFTIDNADYKVSLPTDPIQWKAGENYLYTAKLSGKALNIESVKVAAWDGKTGGNVNVN